MQIIITKVLSLISIVSCLKHNENDPWNIHNADLLKSKHFWQADAQTALIEKLRNYRNVNKAKNVILFLGDGMSVPTVTAARIYEGQAKGILGERNRLSFETFPIVGLSKTYCADKQVADSACSATAYLTGIKANYYTVGVTGNVSKNNCESANESDNRIESIAGWAIKANKSAGIVTTTRITHATPAGAYAHSSNRNFESDRDVWNEGQDPEACRDIARQMIENDIPRRFNVILGGGTKKFLPNGTDTVDKRGERLDGRNLIDEWLRLGGGTRKFVSNREQLLETEVKDVDFLLGLFDDNHLDYHLDMNEKQPTLEEMTRKAIEVLQKDENGFFLLVEGGRIDHAHHETRATVALDETVQFARAIAKAQKLTNPKETLIVVTADHSHTMTINGYSEIGNTITGVGTMNSDIDNLPYATLSYANGRSFQKYFKPLDDGTVQRTNLNTLEDFGSKHTEFPVSFPLIDETHGGSDVSIYANGPWSHLFTGVMEQNVLPSLMGYAACIGPGLHSCYA